MRMTEMLNEKTLRELMELAYHSLPADKVFQFCAKLALINYDGLEKACDDNRSHGQFVRFSGVQNAENNRKVLDRLAKKAKPERTNSYIDRVLYVRYLEVKGYTLKLKSIKHLSCLVNNVCSATVNNESLAKPIELLESSGQHFICKDTLVSLVGCGVAANWPDDYPKQGNASRLLIAINTPIANNVELKRLVVELFS